MEKDRKVNTKVQQMLLQQRSVECPYQDTEEGGWKTKAILKSFHQGMTSVTLCTENLSGPRFHHQIRNWFWSCFIDEVVSLLISLNVKSVIFEGIY